jgi:hypothetical protein
MNLGLDQPIPAVDPQDLRAVWEFVEQARAASGGAESSALNFNVKLLADVCSPGANVFALSMRRALIEMWVKQNAATAQDRAPLDGPIFELAAALPIPRLDQFNPDDFLNLMNDRGNLPS